MRLVEGATRHIFFTGKGGVGKTSTSCAVAVALADRGRRVLLVSTDPASNLDEVFGTELGREPREIAGVPGLFALNVDPEAAAAAYRERVIGPYRALLPADAVASIEEQLAGACTVEIAAFDEFAKLIGDPQHTGAYDHVVFDTAPTGHTLRLLSLPAAWTGFIGRSAAGTSCLGPLQGLAAQRDVYAHAVATLSDPASTTMVLVSRPEPSPLAEAHRTGTELAAIGVRNQLLVVNGVMPASGTDPIAVAMQRLAREAIAAMPPSLAALERVTIPLQPRQVMGVESMRAFLAGDPVQPVAQAALPAPVLPALGELVAQLRRAGPGVVMVMGKGGVGKTTLAASIAVQLAMGGERVHLTTTDPAAHVAACVSELPPNLTLGAIDPAVEVARYRADVLATTGANLDAAGRALLEEDLASPCTEEVAVFQAFARVVAEGTNRYVVVDTAPTGHTILLLDAAQAYHRELMRQSRGAGDAVRELLPRLRDPRYTRIVLCAIAEATPVHEAAALQADLRRAGMEPYAWVVNQSLAAVTVTEPLLVARQGQERRYIEEVTTKHSRRTFVVPWREAAATARAERAVPVPAPVA